MTNSSPLKAFQYSLHVFSIKPRSSSTLSPMKIKTLVHSLFFSHLCRVTRALSKAKSTVIQILKEVQLIIQFNIESSKKNKVKNKLFFGSFRLHYNWCSSNVHPTNHVYYDSTWDSIISTEVDDVAESRLSGYLHWLEEKVQEKSGDDHIHEIDRLADMFIENCHEKFRLEKQESYRRFQEMMARSV